jgi:hypothetical protein
MTNSQSAGKPRNRISHFSSDSSINPVQLNPGELLWLYDIPWKFQTCFDQVSNGRGWKGVTSSAHPMIKTDPFNKLTDLL